MVELELAQESLLAELVADCLTSGPFAGQPRRRLAAPLIHAAFKKGEEARRRAFQEYLGLTQLVALPAAAAAAAAADSQLEQQGMLQHLRAPVEVPRTLLFQAF